MLVRADIAASRTFETALGFVGIAWSDKGLVRLCLFESVRGSVERRLAGLGPAGHGDVAPAWVGRLVCDVRAYASGERTDFSVAPVDLSGVDAFRLAIYDATRKLGFGETWTYGELAKQAGYAGLAREAGKALGANPVPLVIPCHRILAAGGRIGGFSAPGGSAAKERMLALEGIRVGPAPASQQSFAF